jgi:hypothetical protein
LKPGAITIPGSRRLALALTLLALALALAAPRARGEDKSVRVATPVGTISAKSKGAPLSVPGIPEYPGATRTQGDPDGDGAQAAVKLPVISIKMQALRYETRTRGLIPSSATFTGSKPPGSARSPPRTSIASTSWR